MLQEKVLHLDLRAFGDPGLVTREVLARGQVPPRRRALIMNIREDWLTALAIIWLKRWPSPKNAETIILQGDPEGDCRNTAACFSSGSPPEMQSKAVEWAAADITWLACQSIRWRPEREDLMSWITTDLDALEGIEPESTLSRTMLKLYDIEVP